MNGSRPPSKEAGPQVIFDYGTGDRVHKYVHTCRYLWTNLASAPVTMNPIHPWFACHSSNSYRIITSAFKSPGASYTHARAEPKTLIIIASMIGYMGSALLKVNNQKLNDISLLRSLSIYVGNY